MGQRRFGGWDRRVLVGFLAVGAMGTALLAPLARSSGQAGAVTIDGARSLADKVSVQFQKAPGRTTDVHLLAWNDFHGNLEAGAGLNIYGQFAGGAAWLAKAVEDKQAQYGDKEISVIAGDNIGASPLVDGLFFGEPSTIVTNLMHADFASVGNHEFDKGSAELLRIQNGGCRTDVGCTAAPYALANGGTTDTYPGADFQYLSANVVRNDNGKTLFPAYGTKQIKSDSGKKFEIGIIGEVLEGDAHDRHADRRGRAHVQGRGRQRQRGRQAAPEEGCEHERARDPPGRLPVGHGDPERLRRQPGRQRHRAHRAAARPVDQGHRVGPHPRRVSVHDHHPARRHAAHHQRVVVRPHPQRPHADHRRQVRPAGRGQRGRTRSFATRATRGPRARTYRCSTCRRTSG